MKRKFFLSLFLSLFVVSGLIYAQQDTVKDKPLSKREQRRADRQAERDALKEQVFNMIKDTAFVLELSTLYGRRGESYQLSQLSNFFAVDGDQASIQYAFNNIRAYAGIGGSMSTGDLIQYEVIWPKGKKPLMVRGRIAPHSNINMVLFDMTVQDSGRTRMNMTTASGTRINMEGQLVPIEESTVFRTLPLFQKRAR
jgi:hypothetical protein